jgi:hypothetical protein
VGEGLQAVWLRSIDLQLDGVRLRGAGPRRRRGVCRVWTDLVLQPVWIIFETGGSHRTQR